MKRSQYAGWTLWRWGRKLCRRTRLHGRLGCRGRGARRRHGRAGLDRRRCPGTGRGGLLRLDGSGRNSVVLRMRRRRRPEFGAAVEFVQRDTSLHLPFDDLANITVTAARMLEMQGFISAEGILQ